MTEPDIAITRVFTASRERVWREWTNPESFADWFGGPDAEVLAQGEQHLVDVQERHPADVVGGHVEVHVGQVALEGHLELGRLGGDGPDQGDAHEERGRDDGEDREASGHGSRVARPAHRPMLGRHTGSPAER